MRYVRSFELRRVTCPSTFDRSYVGEGCQKTFYARIATGETPEKKKLVPEVNAPHV